jgi:hypothetical protein
MTPSGSNGAAGYRVVYPEGIRQQVRNMRASLPNAEARRRFDEAVRAIHRRLQNDPLEFGEPIKHLDVAQLNVRLGGVAPLVVRFAVHEARPLVFVTAIVLLSGPGV